MTSLIEKIEQAYSAEPHALNAEATETFEEFKALLNQGEVRAAEKQNETWQVNQWVKKGILLGFRLGKLV
ncbi:MAG: 2,3,4,5-tetrahydropyridine-2,6-dicarboxylate N-succinyltransferase, partial [bacterium]